MFGLDPMVVLGLATGACGAVGWLLGPFVGNAVFGLWYRRFGGEIAVVSFLLCSFFFSFLSLEMLLLL